MLEKTDGTVPDKLPDEVVRELRLMPEKEFLGKMVGNVFVIEDFVDDKYNQVSRLIALGAWLNDESIQHITDDWVKYITAFRLPHEFRYVRPAKILGTVEKEEAILEKCRVVRT